MFEEAPQELSEQAKVAHWLAANHERIVADWMDAVLKDEQIPTADRLTMSALQDHFPEMLQELIETVREGRDPAKDREAGPAGRAHGKARWRHGYRLNEVLRELARIRELLIKEIATYCRGKISEAARDGVVQTTRLFFDTIVATSAQQFVQAQEAEVVLRSSQLEHAYEQVQATTEQLRSVAESRLRLLRAVTHELRNALQPVTFAAQDLLEESNPVDRQEIGNHLTGVTGRLQTLLDRLRELSLFLSGEARVRLTELDLRQLLRELEEKYRPAAERKGLQFQSELAVEPPEIQTDSDQLRQIGDNLLSNAIQFTKAGYIRLEFVSADGDRWILRVTDTGIGIGAADAKQIFNEFHAEDSTAESGLHLGLIFTRHLAHLLGGEITFRSTLGEGSCFEVNLPRVSAARD